MSEVCEVCNNKGWVEAEGRLGLEIQMCQDCYGCKSDEEAYQKASQEIDVGGFKHDDFVYMGETDE